MWDPCSRLVGFINGVLIIAPVESGEAVKELGRNQEFGKPNKVCCFGV